MNNYNPSLPQFSAPQQDKEIEKTVSKEQLLKKRVAHLGRRVELKWLLQSFSSITQEYRLYITEIDLIDQELKKIDTDLDSLQKKTDRGEFNRINPSPVKKEQHGIQVEEPWEVTVRIGNDKQGKGPLLPADIYNVAAGVDIEEIDIDAFHVASSNAETAGDITLIDPKPIL